MADIFSDLIPEAPASGGPARPDGTIFDDLMAPAPRFPGSPGAPLDMGGEMPIAPFESAAGPGGRMVPGAASGVPFLTSGLPPIAPAPGDGPLTAIVSGWQPPAGPEMDPMTPIPMPADPYAMANPWLAYPGLAVRGAAETGLTMGLGLSAGAQQPTDEGNALWDAYLRMDPKSPADVAEMRRRVQASPILTPGNKQAFQSAISDRMEGAPAVWKRDLGIGPPVDSDMAREMERRQDQLRNYMPASREQESNLFGQALRGGGSTALFLPFAALPGGIWAAGAAAGMGEAAQRAYQGGATDQQQRRATMLGAGPGALDALAVESVLRPIVRAPGAMGWVQGVVATALRTGLIEGTTEGVQQFAQNLIARTTYNPEQALAEGVPENVVVGFLAGVGLGGVGGMFARRSDGERYLPTRERPPASAPSRPTVDVGMPEVVPPSPALAPTPATAPSSVPAGAVPIDVLYGVPSPTQPTVPAEAAAPVPPDAVSPQAPNVAAPVAPEVAPSIAPESATPVLAPDAAAPVAPDPVSPVPSEDQADIFADLVAPASPQPVVVTPPEPVRPRPEGDAARPLPPEPAEPVAAPDAPRGRGGTIFDDLAPAPAGEMVPGGAAGLFPDARPAAPARRGEAPVGLESVDPASVRVDAERFQFKGGGDAEGVTERLQGVQTWDPMRAGIAVVYEEADGSRYIVDGHQRLALAKRLQAAGQSPRLNAMVLREADGVTPESARIAAALKNIAEGTGTAVDAARVFRDTGLSDEMVRSLPPRSVLVRDGQSLARLSDDALGMVINGVVPENFAAFVGRENFTPTQQLAALQALARAQPANATQAGMMVRDIRDSGFLEGEQSSLFGEEAFAQTLIAERAKVLDAAMKRLRTDRATFRTLVERSDIIAEAGNQLAQDANAARLTEDEQAAALLSALATRRGPLSDALNDAARKLAAGTRIGSVTADFLRAVRQLAGLAAEGREPGDAGAGAGRADAEPRLQRAPGQVVPLASRVAGIQSPATAADRAAALGTARDIVRRIAGDTGIAPQVADRLFEVDRSGAPVGEVYGAFDPSTRQILASLASPNMEGTIRHELIHALRAVGAITPEQWQVLERAARDQGWVTDRIRRGYPAEQQLEEAVAQRFADYMGGRINPLPAVNRIFAAIRNFLNRLRQSLRMNPTWRSIFQDIEAGRMARPDRAQALAGAPAMQQGDIPQVPDGFFGQSDSTATIRRAARAWAERNLYNRAFRNADSGIEIRVNRAGLEKVSSHGPMMDQLLAVVAIPEMIERARFVWQQDDVKSAGSALRYLHFATEVQIGDRVYDVDVVARKAPGAVPVFYYDHQLTNMRERGRAEFREGGRSADGSATDLPPGARTDNVGGDDTGGKFQRRPPPPRRTSADGRTDLLDTVDGPMEQFVLPGAERLTDRQLAERQMQERLRSRRQQQTSAGPLFDGPDDGQGSLFQRADDGAIAPPFYSALSRGVERLGLGKGSGAQWAGAIRNLVQKGVKQAEIDWSGVLPWLAEQTGTVSRADVVAYLRSQAVDVQEIEKAGDATRWGEHTLPGGQNYRELLLTLPRVPTRDQITPTETAMAPFMPEWNRLTAAIRDARARRDAGAEAALTAEQDAIHARMVDATIAERGGLGQNYTTPHFEEPNVLAHVRFNERTGPNGDRVLFIEEIQSDWHQAGRKKGYTPRNAEQLQARRREIEAMGAAATEAQRQEWAEIMNRLRPDARDYEGNTGYRGVPDAPLKTTWPETAFRRMVRWAAEHGFDRIAWTTGDMQTERFDLSKQVDSLLYKRNPDGTYRVSAQIQGRGQMLGEAIPASRLEEYVGKEIAERIVAGAGAEMDIAPNNAPRDVWRSLKGIDLKVGGEGMRGFYDRILPAYASKFGKPFGAKAEMAPVRAGGGVAKNVDVPFDVFDVRTGNVVATYRTETAAAEDAAARGPGYEYAFQKEPMGEVAAHSLPITPEMANTALGEGFPLWQIPDMDERQSTRSRSLGRGIRDGRPIDQLLALPFRAIGGVDVQGRWKPGRKLFDWGASVLTEKKMNPNGPLRWINPMLETARAGLVDRYGLDPAYVARDRARQVEEIKLASRGLDFLNDLKKRGVDAQEAKALHAILTGEQLPESEWTKIAEPIRNAIDDMGLTAVSLGLVDRESYERNKGAYLHRSYLKHEAENAGGRIRQTWNGFAKRRRARIAGDALKGRGIFVEVPLDSVPEPVRRSGQRVRVFDRIEGDLFNGGRVIDRRYALPEAATPDQWTDRGEWQVREIRGDKAVIWRDYTKPERQQMGEIIDARYTIAKTFHLLAHDISVGRFYADIAHNDDWARTMEPAAGTWINAAEANRAWSTATGYEWVRVPDSTIPGTGGKKHWGALSGKWVRAEIWRDLNQVDQMSRQTFLDAIMRQWKQNKTSRSPVTHMNNIMSNVWLMDMADVRMRDLVGGLRSYIREDADYAEARDNGAFGTGFVAAELKRDVLEPVLEEILRENMAAGQPESVTMLNAAGKLANGLFGAVKKADRGMRQLYGMEDDIFRMATYKRRRDLGDSAEMAAAAAREQFVDYDIRAPWINAARRSALPFLAYTYRAVPLVAKAMATKPWKLAKYAILMNALNSLGYLMEPGDEDKERRSLREEQRGWTWLMTPRMIRLGFSDEYGNPLFLDMRRWVPVGDVFDLSQGQSVIAMPGPLAQLGGVLGLGAELALNKNAFTGREIVGKVDDPFEAAGKVAGHTWRWFAPNAIWIPGSWSADKWWGAVAGERDRLGRPYNVPLATLSAFGVKAQPQDVFLGSLYRQFDYERRKREIDMASATAARDLQQGRLNQFGYVSKMRDAQTKRRALDEKFADLLRDRRFQAEQRRLRSQERAQRAQVRGRAMRELETSP